MEAGAPSLNMKRDIAPWRSIQSLIAVKAKSESERRAQRLADAKEASLFCIMFWQWRYAGTSKKVVPVEKNGKPRLSLPAHLRFRATFESNPMTGRAFERHRLSSAKEIHLPGIECKNGLTKQPHLAELTPGGMRVFG